MADASFEQRWADAGRQYAKGSADRADCIFCIHWKFYRFQRPSRMGSRVLCADHRLEADLEMTYLRGAREMFWASVGPGLMVIWACLPVGWIALIPVLLAILGGAWRYYVAPPGGRLRFDFGPPRMGSSPAWALWNPLSERADEAELR